MFVDSRSGFIQVYNTTDIATQNNYLEETFLVQVQPRNLSNHSQFTYKYSRNTYLTAYLLIEEREDN